MIIIPLHVCNACQKLGRLVTVQLFYTGNLYNSISTAQLVGDYRQYGKCEEYIQYDAVKIKHIFRDTVESSLRLKKI